jgi:hypothetical protein
LGKNEKYEVFRGKSLGEKVVVKKMQLKNK